MARRKSPAARTSLYRLLEVRDLSSGVQEKYRDSADFTCVDVKVSDREALLVSGVMQSEIVSWAVTVRELTGQEIRLGNKTAAAVLLIREGASGAWALTYGMGFQLLDQQKVDDGFGQRIAVRTADQSDLNSLTRTTLDHRSRTDRFSIPGGEHLRGFGLGDVGELVTRLVAKASIPGLTGAKTSMTIRGADALSIPLGRAPGDLLGDLDILAEVLQKPAAPGLEVLEQLVQVKDGELIKRLESDLADALANPSSARLALSWPHERIDENGTADSFRIFSLGRSESKAQEGMPTLGAILKPLTGLCAEEQLKRIDRMKIQLFRDAGGENGSAVSSMIPGRKWLAFERDLGSQRYCLHDGRWYLMNHAYADKLKARVEEVFAQASPVSLPAWPRGYKEADYNALAARSVGGLMLDRQFARTEMHRRGIELCDVLAPQGILVHVKSLEDGSAPASHLLAQALVSADALLYDDEAHAELCRLIDERGGLPGGVPNPIHTVVLGVARTRPITAADLFTFTQVTLVRQVAALRQRGVSVYVEPIQKLA